MKPVNVPATDLYKYDNPERWEIYSPNNERITIDNDGNILHYSGRNYVFNLSDLKSSNWTIVSRESERPLKSLGFFIDNPGYALKHHDSMGGVGFVRFSNGHWHRHYWEDEWRYLKDFFPKHGEYEAFTISEIEKGE